MLTYLLPFYKLTQQTESFNLATSIWPAMIKDVIGGEKSSSCESSRECEVSKLADSDLKAHRRHTKATQRAPE